MYKWTHCRELFPSVPWNHSRILRFKWQIFNRNLYRKIFPFYRNYTVAWSLDINVAVALGIWPGCAYHSCIPKETALSGKRRWTRDGTWCHTRNPPWPLSPWYIYQQVSIGTEQRDPRGDWVWSNSLIPLQTPVDNSSPRCDVTWYSQHIDPWQKWEPWLFLMTCKTSQYHVSWQGSSVW